MPKQHFFTKQECLGVPLLTPVINAKVWPPYIVTISASTTAC